MQPNFNSPPNSPPPPDPEPLQVETQAAAAAAADEEPSVDPEEMQIVPASVYNTTPFELPDDWIVEVRPRGPNSPIHSDKYYYEPGTGRKFRSLLSVKRYLTGEDEPPKRPPPRSQQSNCLVPYHNTGSFKRVIYGGKVLRPDELESALHLKLEEIYPETLQFKWADTLPDGWIVEEIPRKCGFRSDRYFIDPVSEQRFRSIPEVHRFLEAQRRKRKSKALALSNRSTAPRSSLSRKKNTSPNKSKDTDSDIVYCPDRVNWVFSGDGRDNWSPLLEQCVIPDYMKEQWSETFLLGMTGLKHQVPQLTMKESNSG